jgi:hypothetical protein
MRNAVTQYYEQEQLQADQEARKQKAIMAN